MRTIKFLAFPAVVVAIAVRLANRALLDPDAQLRPLTTTLGAGATDLQNAPARFAFGDMSPTVVMTGNVMPFEFGLADLLRGDAEVSLLDHIRKLAWPAPTFACGAICNALPYQHISLWALVLPLVILSVLALTSPARY